MSGVLEVCCDEAVQGVVVEVVFVDDDDDDELVLRCVCW